MLTNVTTFLQDFIHDPSDIVLIDLCEKTGVLLEVMEQLVHLPIYFKPLIVGLYEQKAERPPALRLKSRTLLANCPTLRFIPLEDDPNLRIAELLRISNKSQMALSQASASIERKAAEILLSMSILPHLQGYYALKEVIRLVALTVPGTRLSMMKVIYPIAARACGVSPVTAEHSMRHVIDMSWNRSNLQVIRQFFGCSADLRSRPTNSAFIYILAERLRSEILTPSPDNTNIMLQSSSLQERQ